MAIVNLVFSKTEICIKYSEPKDSYRKYPIINQYTCYVMTRNKREFVTDFWIRSQFDRKVVRIWSNQKTGRFGRITYYKM